MTEEQELKFSYMCMDFNASLHCMVLSVIVYKH